MDSTWSTSTIGSTPESTTKSYSDVPERQHPDSSPTQLQNTLMVVFGGVIVGFIIVSVVVQRIGARKLKKISERHDNESTVIVTNWVQPQHEDNIDGEASQVPVRNNWENNTDFEPIELSVISRISARQNQLRPINYGIRPAAFGPVSYGHTAPPPQRPYIPHNDLPPSYEDVIQGSQFQPDVEGVISTSLAFAPPPSYGDVPVNTLNLLQVPANWVSPPMNDTIR